MKVIAPRNGQTLLDLIAAASQAARPIRVINSQGIDDFDWARLHEDARRTAAVLQARGLCTGNRVALIGETSRQLVTVIQASWLCGAAVTVLPQPGSTRSSDLLAAQTRAKLKLLKPHLVCGDAISLNASGLSGRGAQKASIEIHELLQGVGATSPERFEPPPTDGERVALLQFTSGSTSDPRAVRVTENCLVNNLNAMGKGVQLDAAADHLMAWLPLFHDMGLIGMLGLSMATGTQLTLADQALYATGPHRWMEWMSESRATMSCAPNFAYGLAARTLSVNSAAQLGNWRLAINGAEPIDVDTFETFIHAAGTRGFSASSAFCVYGLAEATLAVTVPVPGTGLQADHVDRPLLELLGRAKPSSPGENTKILAKVGAPLEGFEMRIRGRDGKLIGDREVGELELRGPCVSPGYLGGSDLPSDGWLRTGDLAYTTDGQLVICGRLKDVIIVAGRNIYPEDVEVAVGQADGVRRGNVAAFGIPGPRGRELLVVAAEVKATPTAGLRALLRDRAAQAVGVSPHDVLLLAPRTLPKTSSGKLQRSRCRQQYLSGALYGVLDDRG